MKHIEIREKKSLTPLFCQRCGGVMCLVGSEPHPVEARTDVLTRNCTACDEFFVQPGPIPEADD